MKNKTYCGYPRKELEKCKCYIHKNSINHPALNICKPIQKQIKKKYPSRNRMEAKEIVERFHGKYCIVLRAEDLYWHMTSEFYLCSLKDHRVSVSCPNTQCHECKDKLGSEIVLLLRAAIRYACELRDGTY